MAGNFAILGSPNLGISDLVERKKKQWQDEEDRARNLAQEQQDRERRIAAENRAMLRQDNQDIRQAEQDYREGQRFDWEQQRQAQQDADRKAQDGLRQIQARHNLVQQAMSTASPSRRKAILEQGAKQWEANGWGKMPITNVEPVDRFYAKVTEDDDESPDGHALYYHSLKPDAREALSSFAFSDEQHKQMTDEQMAKAGLSKDFVTAQDKKLTHIEKYTAGLEKNREGLEKKIERLAKQHDDGMGGVMNKGKLQQMLASKEQALKDKKDEWFTSGSDKEEMDSLTRDADAIRATIKEIEKREKEIDSVDAAIENANKKYLEIMGAFEKGGNARLKADGTEDTTDPQKNPIEASTGNAALMPSGNAMPERIAQVPPLQPARQLTKKVAPSPLMQNQSTLFERTFNRNSPGNGNRPVFDWSK